MKKVIITKSVKKKSQSVDKLIVERKKIVRQIVSPLVEKPEELFPQGSYSGNTYIIKVRDKVNYDPGKERFRTSVNGLIASYEERWEKGIFEKSTEEFFYLERAYLHFYIIENKEEKEFFLLHCDPNEPEDAPHARYKQSLHLHIECHGAPQPHGKIWPRCHIALNTWMLEKVLESVETFTDTLKETVLMINEQVLDFIKKEGIIM